VFRTGSCVCPTSKFSLMKLASSASIQSAEHDTLCGHLVRNAQQARLAAARLRDPELRRQLLIVAGCYEAMAKRADALTRTLEAANEEQRLDRTRQLALILSLRPPPALRRARRGRSGQPGDRSSVRVSSTTAATSADMMTPSTIASTVE
jgi:hypothetical protein